MPKIQLTTPEGQNFEFDLTAPTSTIGRAPENDLVVPDGSVSSRHGKIHVKGESIELEDLGSTNGTHVGGQRVERADIAPGESFRLGNVQGVLVGEAAAAAEAPAAEEPAAPESSYEEAPQEEEEAPSPRATYNPSSVPVIAGLGATPCPTHQRRGFGPKEKKKDSAGTAFMAAAGLGLLVCAAAAFFAFQMGNA
jgi:predicted component of type VI protein secretion system